MSPAVGIYAIFDPSTFETSDRPRPELRSRVDLARRVTMELLSAGIRTIQLRDKAATTPERLALLAEMGPLCLERDCALIVNDDLAAASAGIEGVSGVHLGQEDVGKRALERPVGEGSCFGFSTHNLDQVRAASARHPDYLGFGPVRATQSKQRPDPVTGLLALARACAATSLPVVAIGGLGISDIAECRKAGASAVAMISALFGRGIDHVAARSREAMAAWQHAGN